MLQGGPALHTPRRVVLVLAVGVLAITAHVDPAL